MNRVMELKYKFVIFSVASLWVAGALNALEVADRIEEEVFDAAIVAQLDAASQEEVQKIDTELKQLQDLKSRYRSSAARHEHEASRWQFEQNLKQEARRASQQAQLDREMERQIQARIDYLQGRRAQIIQK